MDSPFLFFSSLPSSNVKKTDIEANSTNCCQNKFSLSKKYVIWLLTKWLNKIYSPQTATYFLFPYNFSLISLRNLHSSKLNNWTVYFISKKIVRKINLSNKNNQKLFFCFSLPREHDVRTNVVSRTRVNEMKWFFPFVRWKEICRRKML
jgi:hypothetical protein